MPASHLDREIKRLLEKTQGEVHIDTTPRVNVLDFDKGAFGLDRSYWTAMFRSNIIIYAKGKILANGVYGEKYQMYLRARVIKCC